MEADIGGMDLFESSSTIQLVCGEIREVRGGVEEWGGYQTTNLGVARRFSARNNRLHNHFSTPRTVSTISAKCPRLAKSSEAAVASSHRGGFPANFVMPAQTLLRRLAGQFPGHRHSVPSFVRRMPMLINKIEKVSGHLETGSSNVPRAWWFRAILLQQTRSLLHDTLKQIVVSPRNEIAGAGETSCREAEMLPWRFTAFSSASAFELRCRVFFSADARQQPCRKSHLSSSPCPLLSCLVIAERQPRPPRSWPKQGDTRPD
jgi:hypothetical protein